MGLDWNLSLADAAGSGQLQDPGELLDIRLDMQILEARLLMPVLACLDVENEDHVVLLLFRLRPRVKDLGVKRGVVILDRALLVRNDRNFCDVCRHHALQLDEKFRKPMLRKE